MEEKNNKTAIINIRVLPETKEMIKEMAATTFRNQGDIIDWCVAEQYKRMKEGS